LIEEMDKTIQHE